MTHIIGISGISGAGKSTLTKALGEKLQGTTLFWDEYDDISESPEDLVQWYETGGDYTAWVYDDLARTLQGLKQGKTLICPATHKELQPTPYVIVDAPLGCMHQATGQYLDTLVHIDVPLDIALARRSLRDFQDKESNKEAILEDLDFYLKHSRNLFNLKDVMLTADLVIDGTLPCEQQVTLVLNYLGKIKDKH